MSVQHQIIAVGPSPVSVLAGTTDSSSSRGVNRSVLMQNESNVAIYLGGPGVSAVSYGFALRPKGEFAVDLGPSDVLYVVATEACLLNVLYLGC